MHPFSTPWKHWKVFWCFQGVEKRCIRNKWVNHNWYWELSFCCWWKMQYLTLVCITVWKIIAHPPIPYENHVPSKISKMLRLQISKFTELKLKCYISCCFQFFDLWNGLIYSRSNCIFFFRELRESNGNLQRNTPQVPGKCWL